MEYTFEHEHHPEVVENGRMIRRLEKLHLKEDLENPAMRKNLFANLSDEQFQKMLGYINSLVQGKKIDYTYADGQLPMSDTPTLEDKEQLMNETFDAVRSILQNEDMPSDSSLRLAALTLAGAINYIHAYENGNGRTGRVAHYLVEYGSERREVFEKELSALIAKMPLYEGDTARVIDDTPPPELEKWLGVYAMSHIPEYQSLDARARATMRVRIYLEMMKGNIAIPIDEEVNIYSPQSLDKERSTVHYDPGEIDGRELYSQSYLHQSTAPQRSLSELPSDGVFNVATRRPEPTQQNMISLGIDLV